MFARFILVWALANVGKRSAPDKIRKSRRVQAGICFGLSIIGFIIAAVRYREPVPSVDHGIMKSDAEKKEHKMRKGNDNMLFVLFV
jgi:hypothetical protein